MNEDTADQNNSTGLPPAPILGNVDAEIAPEKRARLALQAACKAIASNAELPGDDVIARLDSTRDRLRSAMTTAAPHYLDTLVHAPADWATVAPPARNWLMYERPDDDRSGHMPAGRVGMIAAAGGVGKTWALCQLAVSLASGLPWLGRYWPSKPDGGRVAIVLGEEDMPELQRRCHYGWNATVDAWKACRFKGSRTSYNANWHTNLIPVPGLGQDVRLLADDGTTETEFMRRFRALLDRLGPFDAVILDPLSRFATSDAETDNAAATRIIQCFERLTRLEGAPTVIVAHHSSKDSVKTGSSGQDTARGASGLVDGVRYMANMRRCTVGGGGQNKPPMKRVPDFVRFNSAKSNYAPDSHGAILRHSRDARHVGALMPATSEELDAAEAKLSGDSDDDNKGSSSSKPAKPTCGDGVHEPVNGWKSGSFQL